MILQPYSLKVIFVRTCQSCLSQKGSKEDKKSFCLTHLILHCLHYTLKKKYQSTAFISYFRATLS